MNSFYLEWRTFLALAGWGMMLGLFFDLYRAARYYRRPSPWLTHLGDLSFCLFSLAGTFALLILSNYGEVRGYIFLALGLGLGVYGFAAAPILRPYLYGSVRVAFAVGRVAGRLLRLPLVIFLPFSRLLKRWPKGGP
ncbi:spore cortex biosynthesis protein YabQ [Moorellaceae bacterium AZ2]